MNKKPQLGRYLTFTISKDKSLLDILDSVEEEKINSNGTNYANDIITKKFNKSTCKCCGKIILNKFIEEHQVKCFQNKIEELVIKLKLKEENVKHEIRIKGLEILIERNNEKWNKIYSINNKYGDKRI